MPEPEPPPPRAIRHRGPSRPLWRLAVGGLLAVVAVAVARACGWRL